MKEVSVSVCVGKDKREGWPYWLNCSVDLTSPATDRSFVGIKSHCVIIEFVPAAQMLCWQ